MDTINLGKKVVVSDPCYEIPTWCQAVINVVLPGSYRTLAVKSGGRCSHLIAINNNHCYKDEKFKWERYPAEFGVDSGQAGIFDFKSYRNDKHEIKTPAYDFGIDWDKEDGDKWYRHMCGLTISSNSYGTYDQGVVSSSGYGDGGYTLFVAMKKKLIVGFLIDFGISGSPIKNIVNKEFLSKL